MAMVPPKRSDEFGYDYRPADVDASATIHAITAIGTKRILAVPMTRQQYTDYRGWVLPRDEDGADEGYLVEYEDGPSIHPKHAGYISWSPKAVFDGSYQPASAMSFGHALFAMGEGAKVCRIGWNGKGMWICQAEGNPSLPASAFWNKHTREFAEENGGHAEVLPYFIMKTADGKILMGWLASQTDMLANDWMVL